MSFNVPNQFPKVAAPYKIAIIGEAPGKDEETMRQPFVGMSGRFLNSLLSRAAINRDSCFVGNVCQYRPDGNEIARFSWNGREIQEGLTQLRQDLCKFQPNLCVLLGNVALKAAMDVSSNHPLNPKIYKFKASTWRGSLFRCDDVNSPLFGFKCMASYHPAYCLRDYSTAPILQFDLKRAAAEGRFPELALPQRDITVPRDPAHAIELMRDILERKPKGGTDIEGYVTGMTMCSICESPTKGFIVPYAGPHNGSFCKTAEEEAQLWYYFALIMADPEIPKVWQNGLYDRFVLQYGHFIWVRNNIDDIMLKHWELYCELEKGLAMQASIYTKEPYYKAERKSDDWQIKYIYCGKDGCVTKEIEEKLTPALNPTSYAHYRFNVGLLEPILYMELRGIKYDVDGAKQRRDLALQHMYELQYKMDCEVGWGVGVLNDAQLFEKCKAMCYKKHVAVVQDWDGILQFGVLKDYSEVYVRVVELARKGIANLTTSERGELSTLLDAHMNVDAERFKTLLYETLRLPLQTKENERGEEVPTADYEALLRLWKLTEHPVCDYAIQIRELGTRSDMLRITADPDGRVRCGYNVVGTETGRLNCYTSPTGSGYNLQTMPNDNPLRPEGHPLHKGMRELFRADEGHWFFQCDLSGADGWTVGAYSKMLGDPTMMDDYLYGLKPAKIIVLMLRHGASVNLKPREELKQMSKTVEKESWEYFACKIVQHGASYLMGARSIGNNVFKQSEGKIHLKEKECEDFKRLFFLRYHGVKKWHTYIGNQLAKKPVTVAASGHRRYFMGRSQDILGEALAHEPQANTTYATNLAATKLWNDPENRTTGANLGGQRVFTSPAGSFSAKPNDCVLRIEPLHQVHDALCGQFLKTDTAWAVARIKSYFDNTLTIAGQQIKIPFEGHYGPSWGEQNEGEI
jgi:uracil-DNA glycosylase family 4